jgi:hypothetical protein
MILACYGQKNPDEELCYPETVLCQRNCNEANVSVLEHIFLGSLFIK